MLTINDAMCEYYNKPVEQGGCGLATPVVCPKWKPIDAARGRGCEDSDKASCATWFAAGECKANPGFMLGSCPRSCGQCGKIEGQRVPAWERGLALAKGLPAPPLRQLPPGVDPRKSVDQLGPAAAAKAAAAAAAAAAGEGAPAHHGPSNEHRDEHLAMGHDGRAADAGAADAEAAGAHHGPSNEHRDEHLPMGPDGRASEGGASESAARMRGRGAAGAAPRPKKARALREGEAKGSKGAAPKPRAAATPQAEAEAEAAQAQPSQEPQPSRDGGLDRGLDAPKPAARPAEEPVSLLSTRLVLLWAAMLALCLAILARRVLPCCKRRAIPKGRAF